MNQRTTGLNRRALLTSLGFGLSGGALGAFAAEQGTHDSKLPNAVSGEVTPVCLTDFEPLAKQRLSHPTHEFIAGGAGDEITIRWNREEFDKIRLRPRVLQDVEPVDTKVNILGQQLEHPILLAPTALHRLVNPEGEVATARGAGKSSAAFTVSSFSTRRLSDIAKAASAPLWFQLYDLRKEKADFVRDVVQEAEALGFRALCVTVDAPTTGARNRQNRAKFSIPEDMETPYFPDRKVVATLNGGLPVFGSFTWKDIERVRSQTKLPVLLKGIMNPDDAEDAVRAGVSGIIVSNHGGRCLDTLPATISVLPKVADRVAGRIPILMDGGVRRGTDVLKAIALGAKAVLIGRSYLYGLAVNGSEGVAKVIEILRSELKMAMVLTGRKNISSIDRKVVLE